MKKPIIGAKKKASKARMAEVKKIPSRGLAPTEKAVMKKKAAAEVNKIKPQGISRKVNLPETHYGDIINGIDGDMRGVTEHMRIHGSNIRKAAAANSKKKALTPIQRDMKKQELMREYKKNSAAGAKKAMSQSGVPKMKMKTPSKNYKK